MVEIPLTRGLKAIISSQDANFAQYKWYAHETRVGYYARRCMRVDGKKVSVYLHREIVGAGAEDKVDHVDHNTLNCTRENLRIASEQQNSRNRRTWRKFKGVYGSGTKFEARIGINRKQKYLGTYDTAEQAAMAYDAAAKAMFGEFALPNLA